MHAFSIYVVTAVTELEQQDLAKNVEASAKVLEMHDLAYWPLHNLKRSDVSGCIFALVRSFLTDHLMKVVLNRHASSTFNINAGVPQDSKLRITLFRIFTKYYLVSAGPNLLFTQIAQQFTPVLVACTTDPTK